MTNDYPVPSRYVADNTCYPLHFTPSASSPFCPLFVCVTYMPTTSHLFVRHPSTTYPHGPAIVTWIDNTPSPPSTTIP